MTTLPPEIQELLDKNPGLAVIGMVALGALLMRGSSKAPAWTKDLPSIGGRTNSAWRGKGSFGKSFGPIKVTHK
jgi:hypothetical protein